MTSILLLFIVLTCPDTAKDSKDLQVDVDPTGTFKKKHTYIYMWKVLETMCFYGKFLTSKDFFDVFHVKCKRYVSPRFIPHVSVLFQQFLRQDLLVKTYQHPLRAWRILDRQGKSWMSEKTLTYSHPGADGIWTFVLNKSSLNWEYC